MLRMSRILRNSFSTGFRAIEGRRFPLVRPALHFTRVSEISSRLSADRWSGFMFHANNLHRAQHQLAHQDNKDGTKPDTQVSQASEAGKEVIQKKKKTFLNFFYARWLKFLDTYQLLLERKFPGAMQVYRVFVIGFKDFVIETKNFVVLKKRVMFDSAKVTGMSKREIEMYYRMPGEMWRVGPVLLISALPFANYVVFPIAYCFPKKCLSSHFWTLQQKSQFAIEFQAERLKCYQPVLRHLQLNIEDIQDAKSRGMVRKVLNQIGSGSHPNTRDIMAIKPLFELDTYSLKVIHGPHIKALCRAHGLHTFGLKRRRLNDRADMLHNMDTVLLRDGLFGMKNDELKIACYIRGLNGANMNSDDMVEFLQQWMSVSTSIQPHSYSLLLHLPILLTYNHPNNWALLKSG